MGGSAPRSPFTAVLNQYNLTMLAGGILLSLAFATPLPAMAVGVLEILWLLVATVSPAARRWLVWQELERDQARRRDQAAAAVRELTPDYAARAARVDELAEDIRQLAWDRQIEGALLHGERNLLEELLLGFTRTLLLHQQVTLTLGQSDPKQLEQDVIELGQSAAAELNGERRYLLTQALNLAQLRLEQRAQLEQPFRMLGVRLSTLEMALDNLRSHIFSGGAEGDVAGEMVHLVSNLGASAQVENEALSTMAQLYPGARSLATHSASMGPSGPGG